MTLQPALGFYNLLVFSSPEITEAIMEQKSSGCHSSQDSSMIGACEMLDSARHPVRQAALTVLGSTSPQISPVFPVGKMNDASELVISDFSTKVRQQTDVKRIQQRQYRWLHNASPAGPTRRSQTLGPGLHSLQTVQETLRRPVTLRVLRET